MSGTPNRVRFVTVQAFAALTGITDRAQEAKRRERVWMEGREYRRAPDGRILVDLDGYERWVLKGARHGS